MNDIVIQLSGVRKRFGSNTVLAGVDLSIPRGAVVGLLGTNGAGKTTLLKCLLGLLRIDDGEAVLMGDDPWSLSAETKSRLGYVPQEPRLQPWMTVQQMIGYTAAFYARWDHDYVSDLVERWQVPWEQRISSLSTGQTQKLMLVLALGHRPDLLLLDEPLASLDPVARREFLKSLLAIADGQCHTAVFSTHITSDLERVASHVAVLKGGRITDFEELDALKERVKRLRIRAIGDLPPDFSVPGAFRTEVDGCNALVAVSGASETLVDDLRRQWRAEVTVEDLNLEEIFLEMHDD
jgi:ABC-2 type transport system ATP-binding protein